MSACPSHVIAFTAGSIDAKETITSDPAVVDRPYKATSWRFFEKPGTGHLSGIWEAEPHLERVHCDYDEMCHILEGVVRLTDANGQSQTFRAGETFVVASGFRGTWENLTAVKKVFFILKDR